MDIHHQVAIIAPATRIYEEIALPENIGNWWDEQAVVETPEGTVLEHNPGEDHGVVQLRVVESIANMRVEWECISKHPTTSPASAWTGTRFKFELTELETPASKILRCFADLDGEQISTLDFYHSHYPEGSEFLGFNNFAWGQVLQGLKNQCESHPKDS